MLTRQRAMERNICACLRDKWLGRINMQKSTFLVHFSQRGWGNEKCSNCENCIDLFFTWKSFDRATSSFEEKILSGPRLTVVGCGRQPGICLRHWQCSGPEYLGTITRRRSARNNISHQLGKMAPTTLHRTKQHKQSWARDAGAGVGGWRTMNRTLGLIWRDYRSQGVSTYLHIYISTLCVSTHRLRTDNNKQLKLHSRRGRCSNILIVSYTNTACLCCYVSILVNIRPALSYDKPAVQHFAKIRKREN